MLFYEEIQTMSHELPPFFYEIFDPSLPRLGPGDSVSTVRALDIAHANIRHHAGTVPNPLRVLDVGCGNGAQTIPLARYVAGTIIAVDNHQPVLDELQRRAEAAGVLDKITPRLGDMRNLNMERESFDLVWAESCLFVMGFAEGVAACHDLLVPNGILGASELAWLRDDVPRECRDFFGDVYPAMTSDEGNLAIIRRSGFEVIEHFTLPDSSWLAEFYVPLETRLRALREKCAGEPDKIGLIEFIQREIDIFREYSGYYGYVFYVMRKR